MKKRVVLVLGAIVALAFMLAMLTACDAIQELFGGKKDTYTDPVVVSVETLKTRDGYTDSREYLYNKNCTNPMALDDNEEYWIVLSYDNPDKLAISSVKINGVKYDSTKFDEGSNYKQTKIRFAVEDNATSQVISYSIGNIMYVKGTSTTKMVWAEGLDKTISVSVRPTFNLTLDAMNTDYRMANTMRKDEERYTVTTATYNNEMSYAGVISPDYSGDTTQGESKEGGWVFSGWYTEPNGNGIRIESKDPYFFWCDVTLYAFFERMYNLETVKLDEPIEYTYGTDQKYTFNTGVVVTNRDFKNNEATHYPELVIPDTVVIEEITYTTSKGNFGLDVYLPKISYTEYPVVKIGNLAFNAFNSIKKVLPLGKYIEEIGYGAFWDCTVIERFEFSDESCLKYIGDYAFRRTKALGTLTLPSTVVYLGNLAFRDSGWANVMEKGETTSTLTFKKEWKYVGFECFMNTKFEQVQFEAGCYFESQIDTTEGGQIESSEGIREITDAQKKQNRIGAKLFASCLKLKMVQFISDKGEANALNIIPDYCFDIAHYENDESKRSYIQNVFFNEGLTYIGQKAFNYQKKIPTLSLPASLEWIDCFAFYENESVTTLEFGGEESQLKILSSAAFGNLVNLDACTITSSVFEKYGSGIFRGCDRMKCVIFENLGKVPVGFKKDERKVGNNDLEVVAGHVQADFVYATGEAGKKENVNDEDSATNKDATTYASPMRIFCKKEIVEDFKAELKRGKELKAGSISSGTSSFSSSVFVHSTDNLKDYKYIDEDGKEVTVQVAVQEVYKVSNMNMTSAIAGYSLVYWSERSKYVPLPTSEALNLSAKIIELAYYAVPTSITRVYIPKEYIRLDHDAFNGCTSLTTVEFEDVNTLEYIGDYAFFGTGIKYFIGGKALTAIGQYAFQRCLALKWVDLRDCPIKNFKNGSLIKRDICKYSYEIKDNENDYLNCLGYGAFKGCASLTWVYLPKLQQIQTATFGNCKNLKTVIIPTLGKDIDTNTSALNDNAFYQYGQATTVYDPSVIHQLYILVDASAEAQHKALLDLEFTNDGNGYLTGYGTITQENTTRPTE